METISVVVPCYNEVEAIPLFYREICRISDLMPEYVFEYVFVNDGSKDATLSRIKEMAQTDSRVKYLSLSRNFGKEAAMYAGLRYASGDYVGDHGRGFAGSARPVARDDAGYPRRGYDCVATRRVTRKGEPAVRSFFARLFYRLIRKLSKTEIMDGARDYRLLTRQYVDSLLELGEYNRFSKGLFGWCGFDTKWIEFENAERAAGETKWSFGNCFVQHRRHCGVFYGTAGRRGAHGGALLFLAFVFLIVIFVRALIFGDPVAGWPSLVCIILLLGGIQMLSMGILGEYLAKTYMETKRRPIFYLQGEQYPAPQGTSGMGMTRSILGLLPGSAPLSPEPRTWENSGGI